MKTSQEVLQKYAAGKRNFQHLNLRGNCFKGKDLARVNFSGADIRSANFAGANLRAANFTGAKCGLQKRWAILLSIPVWLLARQAGMLAGVGAGALAGAVITGRPEAAFIAGVGNSNSSRNSNSNSWIRGRGSSRSNSRSDSSS